MERNYVTVTLCIFIFIDTFQKRKGEETAREERGQKEYNGKRDGG